jgi:hypothetical protein
MKKIILSLPIIIGLIELFFISPPKIKAQTCYSTPYYSSYSYSTPYNYSYATPTYNYYKTIYVAEKTYTPYGVPYNLVQYVAPPTTPPPVLLYPTNNNKETDTKLDQRLAAIEQLLIKQQANNNNYQQANNNYQQQINNQQQTNHYQQQSNHYQQSNNNNPPEAYSSDNQLVNLNTTSLLQNKCAQCHTGDNGRGGVSLFNNQGVYQPNVSQEEIVQSIRSNKMPKGPNKLATHEKQMIIGRTRVSRQ